jgi:hypothetical protein
MIPQHRKTLEMLQNIHRSHTNNYKNEIRYDASYFDLLFYAQTFTTLKLERRSIGDDTVQHLAAALRNNSVILLNFHLSHFYILSSIDTHYTESTL